MSKQDSRTSLAHANARLNRNPLGWSWRSVWDVRFYELALVHSCNTDLVQLWDTKAADEFLLPSGHERWFNWGNLWYFEINCGHLEARWRNWTSSTLHSSFGELHSRHKWLFERSSSYAQGLQWHCKICRSRWWQKKGSLRYLCRAMACWYLWVAPTSQEQRHRRE